jgi:hypothetical protein
MANRPAFTAPRKILNSIQTLGATATEWGEGSFKGQVLCTPTGSLCLDCPVKNRRVVIATR